jgi:hypothetical protein
MRTFHVCGFLACFLAVFAFVRCSPIASSMNKGHPAFGHSGAGAGSPAENDVYNLAVVEAAPESGAMRAQSLASTATPEEKARLQRFRETGEIEIPSTWSQVDLDSIQVTVRVNHSEEEITAKRWDPLRLSAVWTEGISYLRIADKDAAIAPLVQMAATSVDIVKTTRTAKAAVRK